MHMPLARPLFGPIASALTTPRPSAPVAASGTTWDAASKTAGITLSNSDLTATTASDAGYEYAKGLPSRNSGKRALKFTLAYGGVALLDGEIHAGLAADSWDLASLPERSGYAMTGDGFIFATDGMGNYTSTDLGLPVLTGEWFALLIDEATGNGWVKTAAGSGAGNPEAGTGAHFTFTPGTAFIPACSIYSADGSTPASVTLDPTYSSGTYAAWDS